MCNSCQADAITAGYWQQKWLEIPYTCIDCSIREVCTNCGQQHQQQQQNHGAGHSIELCPLKDDNGDYLWFGRCKTDRKFQNRFTAHLGGPHDPCRHTGALGVMTKNGNCTPEYMKFFLLSPACSPNSCSHQPTNEDPFVGNTSHVGNTRLGQSITPLSKGMEMEYNVGNWFRSSQDMYGNPAGDNFVRHLQASLGNNSKIVQDYELCDKKWLNEFEDLYREVAANEIGSEALESAELQNIINNIVIRFKQK